MAPGKIQSFVSNDPLGSEQEKHTTCLDHSAMELFNADLFRSFLAGFAVTAVVLAANILPQLGGIG